MRIIFVADFYIDSLTDWSSVYDIMEVYPYLTVQQARLAHNFHKVHDVGMKATMLFNMVSSMIEHSSFTRDQSLFITELVNFNEDMRDDLVEAFNNVGKLRGSDIFLQFNDTHPGIPDVAESR